MFYKTFCKETETSLKNRGEIRCSGRVKIWALIVAAVVLPKKA